MGERKGPRVGEALVVLLDFLDEVNHRGEVVAVTVDENAARVGAQGVALTVALATAQELAVEHLGSGEGQGGLVLAVVVLQEVVGEDNLVEQVPVSPVAQGTRG